MRKYLILTAGLCLSHVMATTSNVKLNVKSPRKNLLQGTGQGCKDANHKVSSIPYWNSTQTLPCMYAGTFNVSNTDADDHNLFYWLFKNEKLESPNLVIWIDGGPGWSSMEGLFIGNGPIRLSRNGTGLDDYVLGLNP